MDNILKINNNLEFDQKNFSKDKNNVENILHERLDKKFSLLKLTEKNSKNDSCKFDNFDNENDDNLYTNLLNFNEVDDIDSGRSSLAGFNISNENNNFNNKNFEKNNCDSKFFNVKSLKGSVSTLEIYNNYADREKIVNNNFSKRQTNDEVNVIYNQNNNEFDVEKIFKKSKKFKNLKNKLIKKSKFLKDKFYNNKSYYFFNEAENNISNNIQDDFSDKRKCSFPTHSNTVHTSSPFFLQWKKLTRTFSAGKKLINKFFYFNLLKNGFLISFL